MNWPKSGWAISQAYGEQVHRLQGCKHSKQLYLKCGGRCVIAAVNGVRKRTAWSKAEGGQKLNLANQE